MKHFDLYMELVNGKVIKLKIPKDFPPFPPRVPQELPELYKNKKGIKKSR